MAAVILSDLTNQKGRYLKTFPCPQCDTSYTRKTNLNKHFADKHDTNASQHVTRRFSCPYCGPANYRTLTDLLSHCEETHNERLGVKYLNFSSKEEFRAWKEREEETTYTTYINYQSPYYPKGSDGTVARYYYVCCRDGRHRENQQSRKTESKRVHQRHSRKLNSTCLSHMYVDEFSNGHVEVKYISAHQGHELGMSELPFLPLPQSIKESVAIKISQGITSERILDDIREEVGRRIKRDNFMQVVSRKHLLTKKDIRNAEVIVRDRTVIRHKDDAKSVQLVVTELQMESYNPVLAFKMQGCIDHNYPNLPEDSFLLVIQTEFQKKLYQLYGGVVLCIDSTHGTNAYRFKLITCMVRDHFGQGQPIGWCISDRETTDVIEIFLRCIKEKSPETDIYSIMTDDDNTGWAAAHKVFGDSAKHLLCSWHVHRAWKGHLKGTTQENQVKLYQMICLLEGEENPSIFHQMLKQFIQYWTHQEPAFIDFFQQHYAKRPETWARCYRHFKHGDTNTNMYVESFHNKLKTNYLHGKANRRVDILLDVLLKIECDNFYHYMEKEVLLPINYRLFQEQDRHQRGMTIEENKVELIEDGKWHVQRTSDTNPGWFTVSRVLPSCDCHSSPSEITCTQKECNFLCIHMYNCDPLCYDFNNGHLCKHIHRVHSLLQRTVTVSKEKEDTEIMDDADIDCLSYAESCLPPTHDIAAKLKVFDSLLLELQQRVPKDDPSVLDHINSLLHNAVLACRAATVQTSSTDTQSFVTKDNINPGQKMELQWKFKKTTKSPGCKKRGQIFRRANREEQSLLMQELQEKSGDNELDESRGIDEKDVQTGSNPFKKAKLYCTDVVETKNSKSHNAKRNGRCGHCDGCVASNCGKCIYCQDMICFGGTGRKKKCCIRRKCQKSAAPTKVELKEKSKTIVEKSPMSTKSPEKVTLTSFLEKSGRMVFSVKADGSCMFHSLSHQLFGSPDRDFDVRSLLVRFESKNRSKFSSLLTQINAVDIETHIKEMLHPAKWGTHVELFAAATYFQIPVYFLKTPSTNYKWEVFYPLGPANTFKYQLIPEVDISTEGITVPDHFELLLSSECHYDSVISISGGVSLTRPHITCSYIDCRDTIII